MRLSRLASRVTSAGQMINWDNTSYSSYADAFTDGVTASQLPDDLRGDFRELWQMLSKFFLAAVPEGADSVICAFEPWHGTVSLIPSRGLDIQAQLSGPTLYLQALHDSLESISEDAEYDKFSGQLVSLVAEQLKAALNEMSKSEFGDVLATRDSIAFCLLVEPDEPPIIEFDICDELQA